MTEAGCSESDRACGWSYQKWAVETHTAFETAVRNRREGIKTYLTLISKF